MKDNPTIDPDRDEAAWRGVPPVILEYYMGEEPAHQPKVQAKAAYDDHFLYVIWKVQDRFVLARRTTLQVRRGRFSYRYDGSVLEGRPFRPSTYLRI